MLVCSFGLSSRILLICWTETICVSRSSYYVRPSNEELSFDYLVENAFTNGMEEDLDLNSNAYNWAVTFFFIGYIM